MKITLNRKNDNYLFECQNEQGNKVLLDNVTLPGAQGVSPMESVLMGLAGCSGIDMISILKKQKQNISSFSAEVEGERVEEGKAKPFSAIHVHFFLEGEVDPKKALSAADLSFDKYCSVAKTLEPKVKVTHAVSVNGEKL